VPGAPRRWQHRPDVCCDRIARESGWAGLTFTFRGTGPSEGDFSIDGWLADVRAAVDVLHARTDITGVWIAGFRLGGTLAILTAGDDERCARHRDVRAPASLRTWVREPEWFLEYARRTGVRGLPTTRRISKPGSGRSRTSIPLARAARPAPTVAARARSADDVVGVEDARRLAAAARNYLGRDHDVGAEADDEPLCGQQCSRRPAYRRETVRTACATTPRAIAALLGWLDRQEP